MAELRREQKEISELTALYLSLGESKAQLYLPIDKQEMGMLGLIYSLCAGDISKFPTVAALNIDTFIGWLQCDVQKKRRDVAESL